MHPSAVSASQTSASRLGIPVRGLDNFDHSKRHKIDSSQLRSLPDRTWQPGQVALPSTTRPASMLPEYSLRRKTPGGVVDAVYDGSPVRPSSGLPSMMHMIVPVCPFSSVPNPPLCVSDIMHHRLTQTISPSHHEPNSSSRTGLSLSCWTHGDAPTASADRVFTHHTYSARAATMRLPSAYQSVPQTQEHDAEATHPLTAPANVTLPSERTSQREDPSLLVSRRQGGSSQAGVGLTGSANFPPLSASSQKMIRGAPATVVSIPVSPAFARQNIRDSPWLSQPSHHSPSVSITSKLMTDNNFRPWQVLQHSYQAYVNLLLYLQAIGKPHPTAHELSAFGSQKLPAYPKPPKSLSAFGLNGTPFSNVESLSHGVPDLVVPHHLGLSSQAHGHSLNKKTTLIHEASENNERRAFFQRQTVMDPPPTMSSCGHPTAVVNPVALSNAWSSLEVLKTLCQQSKWEWVDGILLGGCLSYALEQYMEALTCFSRVVTLDPSHAEATTHMGAALFCMGRPEEAEKAWLRAVKLQPAYLESTEYLVGHLYKHRSDEAVGVISSVQQALRNVTGDPVASKLDQCAFIPTSKSRTSATDEYICHLGLPMANYDDAMRGFGSSGYRISGQDNGRLLALIHAKGTMLYGRKDVERASEAFQEAVLLSVGGQVDGMQQLLRRIQFALLPHCVEHFTGPGKLPTRPLMLHPERARDTARLVFGNHGELPGLSYLEGEVPKRAATQTTSNSLLSLAKILQDRMTKGKADSPMFSGLSQVGDILALYYLSLSLQESPSTANNVGILLAGIHQLSTKHNSSSSNDISQTNMLGIVPDSGLSLALAYYNYGLQLDPNHVHLHTNLGSLMKDLGQPDLAIQMYERAVSCDSAFDIALTNLANAVKDRGRVNDAILYYRRAVDVSPGFAEAVCGLLTALNSVCNWHGRGGVFLQQGKYDRWHVDDNGRLVDVRISACGSGLTKRVTDIVTQQLDDASHWGAGILQDSLIKVLASQVHPFCQDRTFDLDGALRKWAGRPWEGSRLVRFLERTTKVIQRNWYHALYMNGRNDTAHIRPKLPPNLALPAAPTVLPFHTFTCPLPASHIRSIAQRNAQRISSSTMRSSWISSKVYPPPPPPGPCLIVGYVSSDFNNHPLAHLMQSAFGLHNPNRVRAICYATTPSDGSIHRQQIEREAPVFRDVHKWSANRLIEQINQDGVHILVNLNGYTRGARNEIFSARPAPIQMSFMGFAGTLGAEWCDYILADKTAIPPGTLRPWRDNTTVESVFRDGNEDDIGDWMYSENVIFCRDTFFCCDHAQSCPSGARNVTWAKTLKKRWDMRKELFPMLGDDCIVLGNFNQLYKIDPTTFRSWLRILARVPRAILWLLRFPKPGESNLRATALAWAGPEVASRIVFTDVAPKSEHILRAAVCDLFLDTPECNAHTTAADVLWSSTPLLTFPRYSYKMCSRMAASILRGALPRSAEGEQVAARLIAATEADYEQTAIDLATTLTYKLHESGLGEATGPLADMRELLWNNKWQCGLFNTQRWVQDLEIAYEEAWRRWVDGRAGDIYL